MSDLKRLLDEGSPFERLLLESSETEEPSRALEAKILAAIPAAPQIASAHTSETRLVAAAPATSRFLRPAMIAAGAIGLVLVGVVAMRSGPAPEAAPAIVDPAPVAAPVPAPVNTTGEVPTVSLDSLPTAPVPAVPRTVPSARGQGAATASPTSHAPTDETSSLEREIKLLDAVKAKLGAGAHADALQTLDTYDAEFPQGTLRPEATVLRIRTLLLQSRRPEAQRLADDFLAKHPTSVHAKRIRALLSD